MHAVRCKAMRSVPMVCALLALTVVRSLGAAPDWGPTGVRLTPLREAGERDRAPTVGGEVFRPEARIDDGTMSRVSGPVLIADAGGGLYAAFRGDADGDGIHDQAFLVSSPSGGDDWTTPNVGVWEPANKVGAAAVAVSGDRLLMAWTFADGAVPPWCPFLAYAPLGGGAFSAAAPVLAGSAGEERRGRLVMQSHGADVTMAWLEAHTPAVWYPVIATSKDGGNTWAALPTPFFPDHPFDHSLDMDIAIGPLGELYVLTQTEDEWIHFWRSPGVGGEWDGPIVVHGAAVGIHAATSLAVSNDGVIGALWEDLTGGTSVPHFARSFDGGKTWTAPIALSREWPYGNYAMPKLIVDATGRWHVACLWNIPWQSQINLYHASSADGETWSAAVRVNDRFGDVVPAGERSMGLVGDDAGYAHLVWMYRTPEYHESLYYATDRPAVVTVGEPSPAHQAVVHPNPVAYAARFTLRFGLSRDHGGDLEIYSVAGRRVRSWAVDTGAPEILWDLRDHVGRAVPDGVYLVRLGGEAGVVERSKIVVAR